MCPPVSVGWALQPRVVGLRSALGLAAGHGLPKLGRGGTGPSQMGEEYKVIPGQPGTPVFFSRFLPRRGDGLRWEHWAS